MFNLFNPSGQPGLKYMVYELGFQHAGKAYYLAGRKEVRDDPAIDAWKQTTTLYTMLHERDRLPRGPIVGAGVLTLGVTDLIRMLGPPARPARPMRPRRLRRSPGSAASSWGRCGTATASHLGRG